MAEKQAIIRRLSGVESLGSVTVICSDKTGTLTKGEMSADGLWAGEGLVFGFEHKDSKDGNPATGSITWQKSKADTEGTVLIDSMNEKQANRESYPLGLTAALAASGLCNNSSLTFDDSTKQWKTGGDPTEVALLVAAIRGQLGPDYWTKDMQMTRSTEFAFDSDRKLMSVLYRPADSAPKHPLVCPILYAKGAPEGLLSRCKTRIVDPERIMDSAGEKLETVAMDSDFMDTVSKQASSMAESGLRVLGLACRLFNDDEQVKEIESATEPEVAEKELTFIGLIGLIDPPREGVRESIAQCKRAGVDVIMITGDHIATAVAIASSLGIMVPGSPNEASCQE